MKIVKQFFYTEKVVLLFYCRKHYSDSCARYSSSAIIIQFILVVSTVVISKNQKLKMFVFLRICTNTQCNFKIKLSVQNNFFILMKYTFKVISFKSKRSPLVLKCAKQVKRVKILFLDNCESVRHRCRLNNEQLVYEYHFIV